MQCLRMTVCCRKAGQRHNLLCSVHSPGLRLPLMKQHAALPNRSAWQWLLLVEARVAAYRAKIRKVQDLFSECSYATVVGADPVRATASIGGRSICMH